MLNYQPGKINIKNFGSVGGGGNHSDYVTPNLEFNRMNNSEKDTLKTKRRRKISNIRSVKEIQNKPNLVHQKKRILDRR